MHNTQQDSLHKCIMLPHVTFRLQYMFTVCSLHTSNTDTRTSCHSLTAVRLLTFYFHYYCCAVRLLTFHFHYYCCAVRLLTFHFHDYCCAVRLLTFHFHYYCCAVRLLAFHFHYYCCAVRLLTFHFSLTSTTTTLQGYCVL